MEPAVGPWHREIQTVAIRITGLNHAARHVRIRFPVDVMVMMDEIEVLGTYGMAEGTVIRRIRTRASGR